MVKQNWMALTALDRQTVRLMIRRGQTNTQILQQYPRLAAKTIAAVRASLNRAPKFGKR